VQQLKLHSVHFAKRSLMVSCSFPPQNCCWYLQSRRGWGDSKQDINERKFPWHLFLPEDSPWCPPPEDRNKNWLLPANSFSTRT